MRRFLVSLVIPAALLAGKPVRAEAIKIGYVDVQRAVQEIKEGKAARARLQAEVDEARKKVEASQTGFQKMKADYDKQASVLSDEAKRKKQEELQKAYLEMQQGAADVKDSIDKKESAVMGTISQKMITAIGIVSTNDNLAFVLDKQALLFAPNSADITNEVIRAYDDKFTTEGGGDEGDHGDRKKKEKKEKKKEEKEEKK